MLSGIANPPCNRSPNWAYNRPGTHPQRTAIMLSCTNGLGRFSTSQLYWAHRLLWQWTSHHSEDSRRASSIEHTGYCGSGPVTIRKILDEPALLGTQVTVAVDQSPFGRFSTSQLYWAHRLLWQWTSHHSEDSRRASSIGHTGYCGSGPVTIRPNSATDGPTFNRLKEAGVREEDEAVTAETLRALQDFFCLTFSILMGGG